MTTFLIGFLIFLAIGAIAGFLSGLLGIGGGVIVVPAFIWVSSLFPLLDIPQNYAMHIAAGTSLAAMIVTACGATYSHQKRGNVDWKTWRRLLPATIIGVIIGAWIASLLSSHLLAKIFAILLVLIALYICLTAHLSNKPSKFEPLSFFKASCGGAVIGLCAGLLGIGGGALIVPFLLFIHYPMLRVVGTSAAAVIPLSVVGAISYIVTGHIEHVQAPFTTGFIYWPAFVGIAIGSLLLVPFGVWTSHHASQTILKRIFAVLLVLIAIQLYT